MKPLPHQYSVTAKSEEQSHVELTSDGLTPLQSQPPVDFGGPGGFWSPETLLVAAVADCLVLTFRAIASASKLSWKNLSCSAEGTVDRSDGVTRFTAIQLHARLVVAPGIDADKARRLLEKAEKTCLISNSLRFESTFKTDVVVEGQL